MDFYNKTIFFFCIETIRKYNAIKDKKISGKAGPEIKAIGISINNIEKKRTSKENERLNNRDLKGEITKLSIIVKLYTTQWS